jgi:uncharacterized protein YjbJ (UPF0337 family)
MKSSTADRIEGNAKVASGKVKEVAGRLSGSPDLQDRGVVEQAEGRVQKKIGEVKKVFNK